VAGEVPLNLLPVHQARQAGQRGRMLICSSCKS
jgi:hypothetical protein